MVALLVGHWTSDLQVMGSSPGWAPLRSGLGQATYTCVPLSASSIIWYRPRGVISFAVKVTAGLVESNGSEFMANVTCGLTAKKPVSAPSPTLVIEYETTLLLYMYCVRFRGRSLCKVTWLRVD